MCVNGNIPDIMDLWMDYDSQQEKQQEKFPKCCECDKPIFDEYFYMINDCIICEDCLNDLYKVNTDDYILNSEV